MRVDRHRVRVALCAAALSVSACGGEAPTEGGLPPTGSTVSRVSITPRTAELQVAQTTRLSATALDAANQPVSGVIISWASLEGITATVASDGTVTGLQGGTARIVASAAGRADTAVVTVAAAPPTQPPPTEPPPTEPPPTQPPPTQPPPTQPPPTTPAVVASVSVSPETPSLQPGATVQLAASALDAAGALLTGRSVTWTSSATGVATVSPTGLVTGVSAGSATITATVEGRSATATVTVQASAVASVSITRPSATVQIGATTQLTATARDASGQTVTGRPVVWSTSASAVATVSSTGIVAGVAAGTVTITARVDGVQSSVSIQVEAPAVASVSIWPNQQMTILVTESQRYTATVRDASGRELTGHPVVWTSSNTAVATIAATGMATSLSPGTTTITATAGGRSASATLLVTSATPTSGTLSIARDTAGTVVGVGGTAVPLPGVIVVGDDEANGLVPLQAIVVYSLASMPAGASVSSATLPIGMEAEAVFGTPFALGNLYVERTTAIALNTAAIGAGSLLVANAVTANVTTDVTSLVRAALTAGDSYVAFRFRFPQSGNNNGQTDQLELAIGNLTVNWTR